MEYRLTPNFIRSSDYTNLTQKTQNVAMNNIIYCDIICIRAIFN